MTAAMELPVALDDSMPLNVKSHVRVTPLDDAPITMWLSHFRSARRGLDGDESSEGRNYSEQQQSHKKAGLLPLPCSRDETTSKITPAIIVAQAIERLWKSIIDAAF